MTPTSRAGLQEAGNFVRYTFDFYAAIAGDLGATPNQLVSQGGSRIDGTGANPDNAYLWVSANSNPAQALVIRSP